MIFRYRFPLALGLLLLAASGRLQAQTLNVQNEVVRTAALTSTVAALTSTVATLTGKAEL